jgi:signal transduction histidine kinase
MCAYRPPIDKQYHRSDVLDFSKLQQADAESKARSEPINIRDLAKGIARGCSTPHFRRASADKLNDVDKLFPDGEPRRNRTGPNVEVILDIESNVPDIVWSDKVYLTRVIMNLIK